MYRNVGWRTTRVLTLVLGLVKILPLRNMPWEIMILSFHTIEVIWGYVTSIVFSNSRKKRLSSLLPMMIIIDVTWLWHEGALNRHYVMWGPISLYFYLAQNLLKTRFWAGPFWVRLRLSQTSRQQKSLKSGLWRSIEQVCNHSQTCRRLFLYSSLRQDRSNGVYMHERSASSVSLRPWLHVKQDAQLTLRNRASTMRFFVT